MMPYPVADLIVVIQGIAVAGSDGVPFSLVAPYDDRVFQIVLVADIVVSICMPLGFLFNFLILHRAVPGFAAFSTQYLKQRVSKNMPPPKPI